jgi:L-threonylcarbamoyladenylate synthase
MSTIINNTQKALKILKSGKPLIIPTETTYGFFCDPNSTQAVETIYKAKSRKTSSHLSINVSDASMAMDMIDFNRLGWSKHEKNQFQDRLHQLWPGPIALILPSKDIGFVNMHPDGTFAFRCPASMEFNDICRDFGPLYGTSVNMSGQRELNSLDDIKRIFSNTDIYTNGTIPRGYPSTIIKFKKNRWFFVRYNNDYCNLI